MTAHKVGRPRLGKKARVLLAIRVDPVTARALQKLSEKLVISRGVLIDRAVASFALETSHAG